MKHFFTTRVRVVLIVAVLLAVALAVISDLTGLSIPDMVVKGVLTPIRTGVSRLTDRAEQLYSYMFEYESIAAENARLKEELAEIAADGKPFPVECQFCDTVYEFTPEDILEFVK